MLTSQKLRRRKARVREQELRPQPQATPPYPSEGMPIPAATSSLTPDHFFTSSNFPHFQDSLASLLSFSLASLPLSVGNPARAKREATLGAEPLPPVSPHPPGLPKAARISHLKVLQCQGFYQLCGAHQEDVIYLALPLYHMSGSLLGIVGCLGIGQSPPPKPHSAL